MIGHERAASVAAKDGRIRRRAALLLTAVVTVIVGPLAALSADAGLATPAHAGEVRSDAQRSSVRSAPRTPTSVMPRTVAARLATSVQPERTVRIFAMRVRVRKGERRLITAKIYAAQPRSTSDPVLMAGVSVTCNPRPGGVGNAGSTQNLVREHRSLMTPRFIYRAPRTGIITCTVRATGKRPRPNWRSHRSNAWKVSHGSYLSMSRPLGLWSRTLVNTSRSKILSKHRRSWTTISRRVWIGAGSSFQILADHKVTTCSSPGGSKDSTTQGRDLCGRRVSRKGTRVRTRLIVVQLTRSGHACAPCQVDYGQPQGDPGDPPRHGLQPGADQGPPPQGLHLAVLGALPGAPPLRCCDARARPGRPADDPAANRPLAVLTTDVRYGVPLDDDEGLRVRCEAIKHSNLTNGDFGAPR
ncbi:hypothetical protein K8Z61_11560 [Nocardioides sp. TRM66260-LWL]|uniref:proline-rich domain-containing protein n=1 Tax=Nocardioides sp. TRM66260-LWL TaxID=2874478 RepID=UPI001CC64934|nr:proline-rich domain-containing protein [Nocardioides sp. TRM66260-LWL]MBZ5735132.1 hypothetical protein [Nocardioides sp. TRM66260-LWL]